MARATLPLVFDRIASRERTARAGCCVCHGDRPHWTAANAQALAAQHHDRTGHVTWCDITQTVRYGRASADPRQIDLEDAIAAASSGGGPESTPLTDPDMPTCSSAGVSAPKAAPSRHALAAVTAGAPIP